MTDVVRETGPTAPAGPAPAPAAQAGERPSAPFRPRPLDASMTLLREVMERPLDRGYATAAARRADGVRPTRRGLALTLLLALVCGALATRSVLELRRPQPGADQARTALQAQVRQRTAALDAQQEQLDRLRAEVATLRTQALTGTGGARLAEQNRLLELLAGETPVTGPGLRITLADAPSSSAGSGTDPGQGTTADQGRVLDRDLQAVVNGLWAAGAEAVSVNGQRLTARSAIRYAGQAILVDFRPLVPPYVVQAVGDAAGLQTRFAAGSAGAYLQALRDNYGVQAAIVPSADLELPGAGGSPTRFAHARAAASAGTPGSPGASASPSGPSAVPSAVPSKAAGTDPPTSEVSP
jgi:uncharacterized protein YlxW (UPF0749 family)